ncbi:PAS domain-containing protein [Accumulibacter sp.]|uniref:PAS domain-containing protein n=1 Tax=Accumulibacter sp. TaxID=2053492 RepID=UPI0026284E66|nr:PAS domain-containing protein [Accumulibacter sp.]
MSSPAPTAPELGPATGSVALATSDGRGAFTHWRPLPRILLPLLAIVLLTLLGAGALLHQQQQQHFTQEAAARNELLIHEFRFGLASQASAMSIAVSSITQHPVVREAIAGRDIAALTAAWQPMYVAMHREHGICHLEFFDRDGVSLARMMPPGARTSGGGAVTLEEAVRTGKTRSGLELGIDGKFVLWVAEPVFRNDTPIGYVQIGKDIENVFRAQNTLRTEVVVLVKKPYIDRSAWETEMSVLDRQANWDRLASSVVTYASQGFLHDIAVLGELDAVDSAADWFGKQRFSEADHDWLLLGTALQDSRGRDVGDLLVMADITHENQTFVRLMHIGVGAGGLLLALLSGYILLLLRQSKERHKARQEALGELLKFHQDLIDAVPSPLFYKNTEGRYVGGNRAFETYLGMPREQFVGKTVFDIAPRELAEVYAAADRALFDNPGVQTYQGRLTYADGMPREVIFHKTTYTDSQGRVAGMLGLISDITDRVAAERAMAESRNLLLTVLDTVPARVYWKDRQLRYLGCNKVFAADLGFSGAEDLIGKDDLELSRLEPDDPEYADETAVLVSGLPRLFVEQARRTADGATTWQRTSKAPLLDAQGQVIGLLSVQEDITARRLAEERVARSEHLQRAAIEAIDEAFVVFDREDRLVFCNQKFRSLHAAIGDRIVPGATFDELLEELVRRSTLHQLPDQGAEWLTARRQAHRLAQGHFIRHLDGGPWLRIVERKAVDGHTVGFYVDITELQRAREAAEAASAVKSTFLASMSHELRTPMNGVLGMLELVGDSVLSAEQRDCIETAQNSARMLLTLLNEILDFSKIEAGRMDLEEIRFAPRRLFCETVRALSEVARGKGLDLDIRIDDSVPACVIGDPTRLRQIVTNLLGNAIKFTERGRIAVDVSVRESNAETLLLVLSVSDTGIGIPAEKQQAIFDPFSQADAWTTRRYGGTGLGLAICSRLVELMHGTIAVESQAGQGSVFRFTARVGRSDELLPDEPAAASMTGELVAGMRVLLAEDNPTNQKFALAVLGKAGCQVTLAQDGNAAVAAARSETFDAILMDVQMPNMDGFAATRAIRDLGLATPIIGLTSHAMKGFREECLAIGMDDYLSKPVRGRDLRAKLAELQNRAARPASIVADRVAAQPPLAAAAILDTTLALEMMDGDADNLRMMMTIVRDQIAPDRQVILDAMAAGDAALLRKAAHRLKGSLGQIGALAAQAVCAALEAAGAEADAVHSRDLRPQLEDELDRLESAIAGYLAGDTTADQAGLPAPRAAMM